MDEKLMKSVTDMVAAKMSEILDEHKKEIEKKNGEPEKKEPEKKEETVEKKEPEKNDAMSKVLEAVEAVAKRLEKIEQKDAAVAEKAKKDQEVSELTKKVTEAVLAEVKKNFGGEEKLSKSQILDSEATDEAIEKVIKMADEGSEGEGEVEEMTNSLGEKLSKKQTKARIALAKHIGDVLAGSKLNRETNSEDEDDE